MAHERPLLKYIPLAIVGVLHAVVVGLKFVPNMSEPSYLLHMCWFLLFPVYIALIAVWLARRPQLWLQLPWAMLAAIAAVSWQMAPPRSGWNENILMAIMSPFLGLIFCVTTRRLFRPPPPTQRTPLGIRHILLWITTVAVAIAAIQNAPPFVTVLRGLLSHSQRAIVLFYLLIMLEAFFLAQLMIAMVLSRRFLQWILPFALLVFPAAMLVESLLVMLLTGFPWLLDWEGWISTGTQLAILAITLLAWRHSGLLMPLVVEGEQETSGAA